MPSPHAFYNRRLGAVFPTCTVRYWDHQPGNVNDCFGPCGDHESVRPRDLPDLGELHRRLGFDGLLAWAARRREKEPWWHHRERTENYSSANAFVRTVLCTRPTSADP